MLGNLAAVYYSYMSLGLYKCYCTYTGITCVFYTHILLCLLVPLYRVVFSRMTLTKAGVYLPQVESRPDTREIYLDSLGISPTGT